MKKFGNAIIAMIATIMIVTLLGLAWYTVYRVYLILPEERVVLTILGAGVLLPASIMIIICTICALFGN